MGDYYRTYPTYVQHELEASGAQVFVGPSSILDRLGGKVNVPFTVEDGDSNYVSARWPGDAWALSDLFIAKLAALHGLDNIKSK